MTGIIRVTQDRSTSSTSFVDITDLTYAVAANTSYSFRCTLTFQSNLATNGFAFSVNGPASPTMIDYVTSYQTTANGTAGTDVITQRHDVAYNVMSNTTSTVTVNVNLSATIEGTLDNGANSGTLAMRYLSELGAQAITVKKGSSCIIW